MRREVVWSRDALDDIKAQVRYISQDSPQNALRVAERIKRAGEDLGDLAAGRRGRNGRTFEKPLRDLPYVIVFSLDRPSGMAVVNILRVIHMAREWLPGTWPD